MNIITSATMLRFDAFTFSGKAFPAVRVAHAERVETDHVP